MKKSNWFWGIFLILAAALIIVNQFDYFGFISPIRLVITILLAVIVIKSIPNLNFFGILCPIGVGVILYRDTLGIEDISWWAILAAVVFASIGLSMIFGNHKHSWTRHTEYHHHGGDAFRAKQENVDEDEIFSKISFGADSKYIYSTNFRRGEFSTSFGSLQLYFDQAKLHPDGAEVCIEASFAGVEIYVPREWRIEDNISAVLGGVEINYRNSRPNPESPTLVLKGNVQFSGVEVKFI